MERKVIIDMFQDVMTEHAWQKVFTREIDNGLAAAKVKKKKPYLYSLKLVKKWLISKGKIQVDANSTIKTHVSPAFEKSNFGDIVQLARSKGCDS